MRNYDLSLVSHVKKLIGRASLLDRSILIYKNEWRYILEADGLIHLYSDNTHVSTVIDVDKHLKTMDNSYLEGAL